MAEPGVGIPSNSNVMRTKASYGTQIHIYIYINCWIYLWIAMARKRLYMYIGGFLDVLVESCEHLHDVTRFCMF